MPLATQIGSALTRIGAEIKAVRLERYNKTEVDTKLNKLLPPAGTVRMLAFDIGAANPWTDTQGWVWYIPDGKTIGSSASGANIASAAAFDLFVNMWPHYSVQTSSGGASTKSANALTDWLLNKRLLLPDLRGRTLRAAGQGASLSSYAIGATGGSETVALATANMPSHDHTFTGTAHAHTASQAAHNHTVTQVENLTTAGNFGLAPNGGFSDRSFSGDGAGATRSTGNATPVITVNSATATGVIGSSGSGTAHENRSPYAVASFVWLMKATI